MSEILYNTNKQSKDICSVINKYLDYSLDNFKKKLNPNYFIRKLILKPGITLTDILMKCTIKGFSGFYHSNNYSVGELLNLMYIEENTGFFDKIIDGEYLYYFIKDNSRKVIDIISFQEFFEYVDIIEPIN